MNVSDTELATASLRSHGFEVVSDEADAEVVVLNTCSVREKAEQKLFTRIGELARSDRAVGVMGCVAQLEGHELFARADNVRFIAGTRAVARIGALLESALNANERQIDLADRDDFASVPTHARTSRYVGFVPIIEGCNKFCTYCIVPYARGRERSRSALEIVAEIETLHAAGYKEVHLLGQNVNSYRPGTDAGLESVNGATPFSRLLRRVAQTGIERVKFATSFPRDFHEDIVCALDEHENLCGWVHLPVQSGSDRILRAMRRGYSRADFLQRVAAIRSARKQISLTTDIIVGFPEETQADFECTKSLVAEVGFDSAYIFKYSERKGTPAAMLDETVTETEKSQRFAELEAVQRNRQQPLFESYIGRKVAVLAERVSSRSEQDLTGHTVCQKVVNFTAPESRLGAILDVVITAAKPNSLYGQLAVQ